MNIFVCIKQVPDTSEISINEETGTLNRTGVESIINPLDVHALEEALRLRSACGGFVTVLTMGPKQGEEALREALAMGADKAVLCTDKKFAGADTWATACTLEASIRQLGIPDLILCGKQAIDGDTAQVPAELAVRLNIPFLPYISAITSIRGDYIETTSMTDNGFARLKAPLPTVCSVVKSINVPRLISLSGWIRAFSLSIERINAKLISGNDGNIGLKGSPTRVKKITPVSHVKKVRYLDAENQNDLEIIRDILSKPKDTDNGDLSRTPVPRQENNIFWERIPLQQLAKNTIFAGLICVLGEIDPLTSRVHSVTYELLEEGLRLADKKGTGIFCLFPVHGTEDQSELPLHEDCCTRLEAYDLSAILCVFTGCKNGFEPNRCAGLITAAIQSCAPDIILAPASLAGRSYVPLVASSLQTGLTADCTRFDIDPETGLLQQTRPAFGGNIMATIITPNHTPQMATVRPHVLRSPSQAGLPRFTNGPNRWIQIVTQRQNENTDVTVLKYSTTLQDTDDISNASIIISGGRGVGGNTRDANSGFPLLEKFARLVGGSVGASRSAVEAGWAPYHQQVGQTGKTVQPKVYLACGISGAVQHLVGMHDSDTIIAINKDPEAAIFQSADYGFVDGYIRIIQKLIHFYEKDGRK